MSVMVSNSGDRCGAQSAQYGAKGCLSAEWVGDEPDQFFLNETHLVQ